MLISGSMASVAPTPTAFQPYVPPTESPAEFTAKAIVIGVLFGLLFGASTVYLGLRAGLTVSASIPIAVLAISVLKKLGGSTILENNIVQTIGSAGESIAGGVVFTVPALIFNVFRTEIDYSTPRTSQFPNATLNIDVSPEYLGVGYVIGPAIAGTMFAGGVFSWLVLLPLLTMLGAYIKVPFPPIHPNYANNPATGRPFLISEMAPAQLWSAYIRYIGAGAVLAAGLITLGRTIPTIISSAVEGLKGFGAGGEGGRLRTD